MAATPPALALTALAGEGIERARFPEGFQMHLVKPVELGDLANAMAMVLDGGSAGPPEPVGPHSGAVS